MEEKITRPIDKATAGREMLSALRLLAIKGHVPNGRETIERWELAMSAGEPGLGRLAEIQAVLAAFDWETDDRQYALEKVDRIAGGARIESGIEADGSAHLTNGDVATVVVALDEAADEVRNRVGNCADCESDPADLCATCEGRLARADRYDAVYALLRGAL